MKTGKNTTKYILMVSFIFVIVMVASLLFQSVRGQNPEPQSQPANDRDALLQSVRRGNLKQAAKIKGSYARDFDPHWDWVQFDIESLTKNSEAVVIATPFRNLGGRLTAAGQMITTEHEIIVQDVIKGNLRQGSTIKVSLPGGRVEFEDGTSAEFKTPGFDGISFGKTYTLFLYKDTAASDTFALVAGPQGLFETPADGTIVKPHGRASDPAVKEAKGKKSEEFLSTVRKQAQKWPQPKKCCS